MWCLHDIDFKVNYTKDCPTSGRDLKWTLKVKIKKRKRQVCFSVMICFFNPVTSQPLFVTNLLYVYLSGFVFFHFHVY